MEEEQDVPQDAPEITSEPADDVQEPVADVQPLPPPQPPGEVVLTHEELDRLGPNEFYVKGGAYYLSDGTAIRLR